MEIIAEGPALRAYEEAYRTDEYRLTEHIHAKGQLTLTRTFEAPHPNLDYYLKTHSLEVAQDFAKFEDGGNTEDWSLKQADPDGWTHSLWCRADELAASAHAAADEAGADATPSDVLESWRDAAESYDHADTSPVPWDKAQTLLDGEVDA